METQVMSKPSKQVKAKSTVADSSVAGSADNATPEAILAKANEIAAEAKAKADAELEAKAQSQRDAAAKLEEQVVAELQAVYDAEASLRIALGKVGAIGLERLAIALGKSTTKAGRPSFETWHRLMLALVVKTPSFAEQNKLAVIANRHVPVYPDATKVVQAAKSKAQGGAGKGNCSFAFNQPVSWLIAIGE